MHYFFELEMFSLPEYAGFVDVGVIVVTGGAKIK